VLIDDLITKGTEEPYRMFTSRAEFRTLLRQDNADLRLTPRSYELGLAKKERLEVMQNKATLSADLVNFFQDTSVDPESMNPILEDVNSAPIKQSGKMFKIFSRPKVTFADMMKISSVRNYVEENNLENEVLEQAEIQVKYSGYIAKERANVDKLKRLEGVKIPDGFDYSVLGSLSYEAREKLEKIRPVTIAQASRISGVSPSDISVLLVYMGR
ncbi:MAG: tRNA uridine-5-carboxymethylaminomethyl(34) synthesis enzyme MnmG, partial [Eudoraea sp.]